HAGIGRGNWGFSTLQPRLCGRIAVVTLELPCVFVRSDRTRKFEGKTRLIFLFFGLPPSILRGFLCDGRASPGRPRLRRRGGCEEIAGSLCIRCRLEQRTRLVIE